LGRRNITPRLRVNFSTAAEQALIQLFPEPSISLFESHKPSLLLTVSLLQSVASD
jgi:hypothetical protein